MNAGHLSTAHMQQVNKPGSEEVDMTACVLLFHVGSIYETDTGRIDGQSHHYIKDGFAASARKSAYIFWDHTNVIPHARS